jgi:excisionase family DNA binding protein
MTKVGAVSTRISYAEAAEVLECHVSTVPKMVRRGELTSERRRGAALDRAQVEALAERRRARAADLAARSGKRRRVDPRPDTDHEWLRPAEVATMLGISQQAITRRLRRGLLPGTWSHRKWWMRADHLEQVAAARSARQTSQP